VNKLHESLLYSEENLSRWINMSPEQIVIESNNHEFRLREAIKALPASAPVAALLPRGAEPQSTDRVAGLLLLGRTHPLNRVVCNVFYAMLPAVQDPLRETDIVLRPTYWPDRRQAADLPKRTTCGDLVQNYDWIWAGAVLSQLKLEMPKGPVLIAFAPPRGGPPGQLATAVLDLSSWPVSELPLAFAIWTRTISQDPRDWAGPSLVERLRLSLRNFLIAHGDTLFSAIVNPAQALKRDRDALPGGAAEPRDVEITFE
jgi:hypothetical protein